MKAPDKIYIDDLAVVNDCVTKISLEQFPNFSEYIRKDVLLEWASNMFGQVSDMGFDDGDVEHGYTRALEDIIDKLNSM